MKTVILGDTHGRDCWKQIVASESPDRVIFIGDYFDSFDNTAVEQMHNFKEIIDWKQSGQSEVIMLIGNHDYHYMRGVSQYYSGYQSGARPAIEQLLYENRQHMQMAYGMGGFIFTHAGVSMDWLQAHGYDNESNLIDWINDMWKYKPNVFGFAGRDPYGDSKISSPIWIRPYSLQAANRDTLRDQFIQVVGHTTQGKIDTEGKSTGGRYYYIDTLGTSGQYMILEQISTDNGEIKFNTYKR
jgi:UDP-2,3-diacylglucosamine pyrophosphatase LpxH